MQVGPAIARQSATSTILQRSAQWIFQPKLSSLSHCGGTIGPRERAFLRSLVSVSTVLGLRRPPCTNSCILIRTGRHQTFRLIRRTTTFEASLCPTLKRNGDDPEFDAKSVPNYPIFGKRLCMIIRWYKCSSRPNVSLVYNPIRSINRNGIVTEEGKQSRCRYHHLCATGFQAQKMLVPMEIIGLEVSDCRSLGDDDPRAIWHHRAGIPNLFISYGPIRIWLTVEVAIFNSECQIATRCAPIQFLIENGYSAMDVRQDVHDQYNHKVDAGTSRMVWAHKGMSNWYKNSKGPRDPEFPWSMADYCT